VYEIQRLTTSKDRVAELEVQFRFEIVPRSKQERVKEYDCIIEANVWRTDGIIVPDARAWHSVTTLKALKEPVFFWKEKHVIDSLVHRQRQIRLYKTFDAERSRDGCRRINEYIALLIAPTQHIWIQGHNLAARMMKEASDFLAVNYVMTM
jgi:hypothetical protein